MIVFELQCQENGHSFEGWFASSHDYAEQKQRGLLSCPTCGSVQIEKGLMAPHIGAKGNQLSSCEAVDAPAKTPIAAPTMPEQTAHPRGGTASDANPAATTEGRDGATPLSVDKAVATGQKPDAPIVPEQVKEIIEKVARAQAKALENSKWVGRDFSEHARAMHYGELDNAPIHGEASSEEAIALEEEGIDISPLPLPIVPPDRQN